MLTELVKEHTISQAEHALLSSLVDAVFFASLMLEEGSPVRVAIVHHADGAAGLRTVFDDLEQQAWDVTELAANKLDAGELAKLARGLEYGTQLVVVAGTNPRDLWMVGTARRRVRTGPGDVVRIAAPRPGVLIFEKGWDEALRFEAGKRLPHNLEVLAADGRARDAVGAITGNAGKGDSYSETEAALDRLLRRMRATGAGAILAMLPTKPRKAELKRVRHRRVDPLLLRSRIDEAHNKRHAASLEGLADGESIPADVVYERNIRRAEADAAEAALDAAIDDVARLSAIDGAVLAGPGLDIYGAGFLIASKKNPDVVLARDSNLRQREKYPQSYGARHQAAFSFVADQPGRVAFVVSEDGPVTCALNVDGQVFALRVRVPET